MKRKLYEDLKKWKADTQRKPLLLMGARQVGKTFLLKEFGKTEFDEVVYLDLDAEREVLEPIFAGSISPSEIIARIEAMKSVKIVPEKTVIIFDEIQEIPRALTALKYFYEEAPEYYVAASGSLLGIALHPGTSFPVGKVDMLRLGPMDFEEFILATGNERYLDFVDNEDDLRIFADKYMMLFREYLIVGGMPEAVDAWVKNRDYPEVSKILNAILLAYFNDISKHTNTMTATRIHEVWSTLPAQFAKRNEKFMFSLIKGGARAREYEMAVQWLIDCDIVRKVERLSSGAKLPLKAYADYNAFKLYFLDVGLFRKLAGVSSESILDNEAVFREFNGLFAEQFVLQQMASRWPMYYWSSGATAEVDFVTEINGEVVPIEVKSGLNVKAKSLQSFRDKYRPKLAVRFSLRPVEYNDGLLNLPIYLAGMSDSWIKRFMELSH